MNNAPKTIPDHTAVRVALWRAIHLQLDAYPPVFKDDVGLKLIAPEEGWQKRGDMHPVGTKGYRASIVGRARFLEDLVLEQIQKGVDQYVILGAGLDTFAQRHPEVASKVRIFEIDQPETQAWKKKRLNETRLDTIGHLQFVPVDFEAGESWREKLIQHGFNPNKPAVIASTGVTMYLTLEANIETLKEVTKFAKGSTLAMTYMVPLDLIDPEERPGHQMVYEKAKAAGTPFISFFRPEEMTALALQAGFPNAKHVSRTQIIEKYFKGRTDGLEPSTGEEFLVAST
ncbi:class I SAM-dependent methyltransferase [Bdellovibrio bacteriovorus]|uniref:S-adenosyl-L-methionine-dependent methyltransferase n=1 Tax=Bdellovibrio bacteriovorus TaxID=959 RepID=A0A1Z3NCA0_BDEBC|nr:class I SAM-dependent methyltransferase [Bdellovibrio bacteriovorus]ASD65088.1 SAM-dependent methyltransferase [Bdellovibrio bacteriovorus]